MVLEKEPRALHPDLQAAGDWVTRPGLSKWDLRARLPPTRPHLLVVTLPMGHSYSSHYIQQHAITCVCSCSHGDHWSWSMDTAFTQHVELPSLPKAWIQLAQHTSIPRISSCPCGIYCYMKSKPQKEIALSAHILLSWFGGLCTVWGHLFLSHLAF